jgi:hypothetical protein
LTFILLAKVGLGAATDAALLDCRLTASRTTAVISSDLSEVDSVETRIPPEAVPRVHSGSVSGQHDSDYREQQDANAGRVFPDNSFCYPDSTMLAPHRVSLLLVLGAFSFVCLGQMPADNSEQPDQQHLRKAQQYPQDRRARKLCHQFSTRHQEQSTGE